MINTRAKILLNQEIAPGHFKIVLRLEDSKDAILPGQFFHIRAGSGYDPLLRRPLSVHRVGPGHDIVEIIYKIIGKGTHLISRRSKGTYLDVIGPLGNGFRVPKGQSNFILVAGGMGVAPLVALADKLAQFRKRSIIAILGCRSKSCIICRKELEDLGIKVIVVTEDGSEGVKGVASVMLKNAIESFDVRKAQHIRPAKRDISKVTIAEYSPQVGIYACGPTGMLKDIAKITRPYRISTQVSLEERMGCGLGACLGCAVRTTSGYKRVCKDGPVFELEEIVWE